jgi:hypothetical protein
VAYEVLRTGLEPTDFRRVKMVNWTALLGTELGVRVRRTTRSWIVHVEVIRGRTPIEVTTLAVNLANRVRDALVSKYGCVLGEAKIVAGELANEDPVATLFGRYFTVRTDKRKIDHSWTVGELEHLQRDSVIEYLQMPERVKSLDGQVKALNMNFEKLAGAMGKLFSLEEEPEPSAGQRSMKDYVS